MEKLRQNIERWAEPACALARQAGLAILEIYHRTSGDDARLQDKQDDSPLTLADLASHDCIVAGLKALTPDIPVVSEEDNDPQARQNVAGCFWLIDPLDGTKEFLARNGEFTVNIALVVGGQAVFGVVYAPVLDQMYWGGPAFGAWCEQAAQTKAIRVAGFRTDRCRVVASKSHLNAQTQAFIDRLGVVELVQAGSSLKFCRVAEGAADVYPRLAPTCEWDTAAAQAVLEGAGGYVVDEQGASLRYGKSQVLNPHFIAASVALSALGDAHG